ncbi:MAG: AAA family ATPase [Dehalococcoidia bacterium]|nr:AAA family ATPase [Dehalococcoidia bacterium]
MREEIFDQTDFNDSMKDLEIIREGFTSVIFGQSQLIERVIITLLTNNHCLIEGVPGLAKTLTVQTLASVFDLEFTRVQFTPDLLPADITGTMMYDPGQGLFNPHFGPVFTNILLADEINRAPAKVHSALLEAMQEQQVSMGGQSYTLPKPFMVLATQNPIEYEATYALPEAQLDRFMLKIVIDYPTQAEGREILDASLNYDFRTVERKINIDSLNKLCDIVRKIVIDESIREYILRIVHASRNPSDYGLSSIEPMIDYGASPRAATFLAKGSQALAFLNGREYVTPDDVKALAPDVLRHRLVTSYEADAAQITVEELIRTLLEHVNIA